MSEKKVLIISRKYIEELIDLIKKEKKIQWPKNFFFKKNKEICFLELFCSMNGLLKKQELIYNKYKKIRIQKELEIYEDLSPEDKELVNDTIAKYGVAHIINEKNKKTEALIYRSKGNNMEIGREYNKDDMGESDKKREIVIRDESETLTGKGSEFRKKDPNRILYTLPYVVILLPIALIIIWTILEAVGFIKRG